MKPYYNYFFIVYLKPSKTRFKAKAEFLVEFSLMKMFS